MVQFHDMPRAPQSDDAPKRSPRKRANSPRTTAERVPRRTAPRKRAPAKRTSTPEEETSPRRNDVKEERVNRVERKAPTPVAATRAQSKAKQVQVIVSTVIIMIGIGASAAVGITDEGQIDVVRTIEERNERIRSGQVDTEENTIIVPVQNTTVRQADGGLRGLGVGAAPPPEIPETEASSTDDMASSTDAMASSTEDGEDSVPLETADKPDDGTQNEEGATQ